ncbi:helix-turn-helix domain-containing protein [Escherichia coli]|uniref:helix-turn-helix domain-containing protein n=2 Tax=Escherichia coli TaxID=562 RepID=UPI001917DBC8|nr:helix-turn-helix domain-containing protein [Escherichia coli]EIQ1940976.1 helix-turn-helix domain-containing protein [Escherichia coli]EIQ2267854.1 helix-turn-helix domain-containing protein [Escherichia coli]CAD6104625.1 transcriptional activator [Escherichia coli]CAD6165586.1 transcriptional activator [Escherichia coli]
MKHTSPLDLKIFNLASSKNYVYGKATLGLKNVRLYNCVIIHIKNARLLIKTKDDVTITIPPGSICYIEKNVVIDVALYVLGNGIPYEIFYINSNILSSVNKVMAPLLLHPIKIKHVRKKIFNYQINETDQKVFETLNQSNLPQHRKIYKISYLLSKFSEIESLAYSLSVSTDTTFTEKIKMIIESDLSKSWRLHDLAKILHISEIAIRKKLEKENNNFNKLIVDIRMQNAAKLITTTEKHINNIAYDVGYMSTSYFIKNFKSYFGITPKQFSLKIKH